MKRLPLIIAIILTVAAASLWMWFSWRSGYEPKRRVLVVSSYAGTPQIEKEEMLMAISALKKLGVDAEISHFVMDAIHSDAQSLSGKTHASLSNNELAWLKDSIIAARPEIVVLEDDPALQFAIANHDSILHGTPMVFFDVNMPDSTELTRHRDHITGFVHVLDLRQNLEFAHRVTNSNSIFIELDHSEQDSRLRKALSTYSTMNASRYLDNQDFHLGATPAIAANSDNIAVTFFSVASPEMNCGADCDISIGMANTDALYKNADSLTFLFVKHDLFSDAVINRCQRPHMACINDGFAESTPARVLGGYFPKRSEQIGDALSYVARILQGEKVISLPIMTHKSANYLDYEALEPAGLKYDDWADQTDVHLERVPWEVRHRFLFFSIVALGVLALGILSTIVVASLTKRSLLSPGVKTRLQREVSKRTLLLDCKGVGFWRIMTNAGVFCVSKRFAKSLGLPRTSFLLSQMRHSLLPDSLAAFNSMTKATVEDGVQKVRLQMRTAGPNDFHWWEFRFFRTVDGDLMGLAVSVDELKRSEDELRIAHEKVAETELKESFLASISHDIRTPLGAVTGFAELLTNQYDSLSADERLNIKGIIQSNADMMLKLIDDVLSLKNMEGADFRFDSHPTSVSQLIEIVHRSNSIVAPAHLQFRCVLPEPDCMINVDPKRAEQILNNFLSNAFKFTSSGHVEVGGVRTADGRMELYVEDTGRGLTEKAKQNLWQRHFTQDVQNRGFGLGLDICHSFAEMMGAEIGVESTLGVGSRFFCRFDINEEKTNADNERKEVPHES